MRNFAKTVVKVGSQCKVLVFAPILVLKTIGT